MYVDRDELRTVEPEPIEIEGRDVVYKHNNRTFSSSSYSNLSHSACARLLAIALKLHIPFVIVVMLVVVHLHKHMRTVKARLLKRADHLFQCDDRQPLFL